MTAKTATLEITVKELAILRVCTGCNMGYDLKTGALLEENLPPRQPIAVIARGYCFPCHDAFQRSITDYEAEEPLRHM